MIFTFYSYKGGVGRTMALVNIAELLHNNGYKVLMVDFDLEAPGIERFYPKQVDKILDTPGIVDMLLEYMDKFDKLDLEEETQFFPVHNLSSYMIKLRDDGNLWLLPAGKRSGDQYSQYSNRVKTFDWKNFYDDYAGEIYFEKLREQMENFAEVVLIDSRTGVTEMGGVCTYQIADLVVMFCAANDQSIDGTLKMLESFSDKELPDLRYGRPLKSLIIPSRIERTAETESLNEFRRTFEKTFIEYIPNELHNESDFFVEHEIQYIPLYAFTETIAVIQKETERRSIELEEAYNKLLDALGKLTPPRIFISYSPKDEKFLYRLEEHLANLKREGKIDGWYNRKTTTKSESKKDINDQLDKARIILLLISPEFMASEYCDSTEIRSALRRHETGDALVIPIILHSTDLGDRLRELKVLPENTVPISNWPDIDSAFLNVTSNLKILLTQYPGLILSGRRRIEQIPFVNRHYEIREITKPFYVPFLLISAPEGYGKTRLLEQVITQSQQDHFCINFALLDQESYSVQKIALHILTKLGESSVQILGSTDPYEIGGKVGLSILKAVRSKSKQRVLIAIDNTEAIKNNLVKELLNDFLPAVLDVMKDARETIPLRIIFSGRYINYWQQLSSKIPLTAMVLTPFEYDAVHQTVIQFNSQRNTGMAPEYVSTFASYLMHFTGGHPGCMANILKSNDFGLPIKNVIAKEETYLNEVVYPFVESIERDIPLELRDIFETISAIRRFNAGLLQWLIDRNLIKWAKPAHDLEDQLLQTYLINIDEGFLNDEITRRLFAIRLRKTNQKRFIKISEESISYYKTKLTQTNSFGPHIIGIEVLFQKLNLLLTNRVQIDIYLNSLKEVLNLLKTFPHAIEIIGAFEKRLSQDWEFQFTFNYIFPEYPFNHLINEITTFRISS